MIYVFKFSCICKEGAAVMVVACFHRDFCATVVVRTGFGVSSMNSEHGETVQGVLACWEMAAVVLLDNLRFFVVCHVGEIEFC